MRTICLAMILPLALLSCSEDGAPNPAEGGTAIAFTTEVTDGDTRAPILDIDGLKDAGFRVSAYATGTKSWAEAGSATTPDFMYDQPVQWGNGKWSYTPVKYWPAKVDGAGYGKVTFFAWSAGTGATLSDNTLPGAPILTYTVPDAVADQRDLLADVLTDRTWDGGNVKFTFDHLLSRIGFTATQAAEYPGVKVKVTAVKVRYAGAVASEGNYTYILEHDHAGEWSYTGAGHPVGTVNDVVKDGGVELDNSPTPQTVRLNGDDRYLMLLPQEITAGSVEVEVSWTVDDIAHTKTLELPAQVWGMGKRYDYNIRVTLTTIILTTIAVDEWGADELHKPCTITYNANGELDYDDDENYRTVTLPWVTGVPHTLLGEDIFYRPMHTAIFTGWNTQADGLGDNYMPDEPFIATGDVTLYAQWESKENCYIVEPGDMVSFLAPRAYTDDGKLYTGTFTAEVLWEEPDVIYQAFVIDDRTRLKIWRGSAIVNVDAGSQPGNAVVAVKRDDTDEIVWSYHIWVTNYIPDEGPTYTMNGYTFMDRNLGAMNEGLSEDARGLHYQWGRKDPFASGHYTTEETGAEKGTVAWSIRNPNVFLTADGYDGSSRDWLYTSDNTLWGHGAAKSAYDPCPAGWRVPAYGDGSPWAGFATKSVWYDEGGRYVTSLTRWSLSLVFPAAGYLGDSTGELNFAGGSGWYWSATTINKSGYDYAQCLYFESGLVDEDDAESRANGGSVRCVRI